MRRGHESGKPFFAYVPMSAMHFPTAPAPEFAGRSGHGEYTDMLMQTDHLVGQMLDALEQMGIAENTLVIFTADNGVESPDNGDGQYNGWAGPWRGPISPRWKGDYGCCSLPAGPAEYRRAVATMRSSTSWIFFPPWPVSQVHLVLQTGLLMASI